MSYQISNIKYPNHYNIDVVKETAIVQEILLLNNGTLTWPKDIRLELIDKESDLDFW